MWLLLDRIDVAECTVHVMAPHLPYVVYWCEQHCFYTLASWIFMLSFACITQFEGNINWRDDSSNVLYCTSPMNWGPWLQEVMSMRSSLLERMGWQLMKRGYPFPKLASTCLQVSRIILRFPGRDLCDSPLCASFRCECDFSRVSKLPCDYESVPY